MKEKEQNNIQNINSKFYSSAIKYDLSKIFAMKHCKCIIIVFK